LFLILIKLKSNPMGAACGCISKKESTYKNSSNVIVNKQGVLVGSSSSAAN
jgi:hypothetical protein